MADLPPPSARPADPLRDGLDALAHDLRNGLNVAQLAAQLLDPGEERDEVRTSAARLAMATDLAIDVAREVRVPATRESTGMGELLAAAGRRAARWGGTEPTLPDDVDVPRVDLDPHAAEQALAAFLTLLDPGSSTGLRVERTPAGQVAVSLPLPHGDDRWQRGILALAGERWRHATGNAPEFEEDRLVALADVARD
jgi:hypothetical protein